MSERYVLQKRMVRSFQHSVHQHQEEPEHCRGMYRRRYKYATSLHALSKILQAHVYNFKVMARRSCEYAPCLLAFYVQCIRCTVSDTTTVTTTTTTTTTTPTGKCSWGRASQDVKCNQGAGEVPLKKSSVMASSLEQCKKSCEDAAGCRSVTYFKTKWCAHFSTPCTKTKKSGKAVVERMATACTPAQTTSKFTEWLCRQIHACAHKPCLLCVLFAFGSVGVCLGSG